MRNNGIIHPPKIMHDQEKEEAQMVRMKKFNAMTAFLSICLALSACGTETTKFSLAESASEEISQTQNSEDLTEKSSSQKASSDALTQMINITNPRDEVGKIKYQAYKDGIKAVLINDETMPSIANKKILEAYTQCLASATYPKISASYAQAVTESDNEKLNTVELTDDDAEIFDTALNECLTFEQEN